MREGAALLFKCRMVGGGWEMLSKPLELECVDWLSSTKLDWGEGTGVSELAEGAFLSAGFK